MARQNSDYILRTSKDMKKTENFTVVWLLNHIKVIQGTLNLNGANVTSFIKKMLRCLLNDISNDSHR